MYNQEQLRAMAAKVAKVCELHDQERDALAEGADVECDSGYWGAIAGIAEIADRSQTINTVSQGDAVQNLEIGIFEIEGVVILAQLYTERYSDDDFDGYLTFEVCDEPFDQTVKEAQLGAAKDVVQEILKQFDPDTVKDALNQSYGKASFEISMLLGNPGGESAAPAQSEVSNQTAEGISA